MGELWTSRGYYFLIRGGANGGGLHVVLGVHFFHSSYLFPLNQLQTRKRRGKMPDH